MGTNWKTGFLWSRPISRVKSIVKSLTNISLNMTTLYWLVLLSINNNACNRKKNYKFLLLVIRYLMWIWFILFLMFIYIHDEWRYPWCMEISMMNEDIHEWRYPWWIEISMMNEYIHDEWRYPWWMEISMMNGDIHDEWRYPCWMKISMMNRDNHDEWRYP